jgi:Domain of unknown function (DUF4403)
LPWKVEPGKIIRPRPNNGENIERGIRLAYVYFLAMLPPKSMAHSFRLSSKRGLVLAFAASLALGCHVTIHTHGSTTVRGDGKDPANQSSPKPPKPTKPTKPTEPTEPTEKPGSGSPKPEGPKAEPPKPDKPKPEAPKGDKPTKPEKDPETDKPKDPKPTPPLPPSEYSRLLVPVRLPFEELVKQVDALLPKTVSENYKRVTKDGDPAILDVKYTAWRDPIEAKFKDRTLHLVIPVRYAANIRGKIKSPFGNDYFPLVEGQTWGTRSKPERMRISIQMTLDVNDEWKLTSQSKLEKIEHGPAPEGNFCAKVGIDVCTPKANLAGEVRKNIEGFLVPKLEKDLRRADRDIEKTLDVRRHAGALWAALQKPLPLQSAGDKSCPTAPLGACEDSAWLVFSPKSLGISELSLESGSFGVDVSLEGKLKTTVGKKPKVEVKPLPKPGKPEPGTMFQLRASVAIPFKIFGREVEQALARESGSKKLELREVKLEVLGDEKEREIKLSLKTAGVYEGELSVLGRLVLDPEAGEVRFDKIRFSEASEKLFDKELKSVDKKELLARINGATRLSLGDNSKALRRAMTRALGDALPDRLAIKGKLENVSFIELNVQRDTVVIQVDLSGSLTLEYSL